MIKIFLSSLKKTSLQRKLRQTKCLLFNFWMLKFTVCGVPGPPGWWDEHSVFLCEASYKYDGLIWPLSVATYSIKNKSVTKRGIVKSRGRPFDPVIFFLLSSIVLWEYTIVMNYGNPASVSPFIYWGLTLKRSIRLGLKLYQKQPNGTCQFGEIGYWSFLSFKN